MENDTNEATPALTQDKLAAAAAEVHRVARLLELAHGSLLRLADCGMPHGVRKEIHAEIEAAADQCDADCYAAVLHDIAAKLTRMVASK